MMRSPRRDAPGSSATRPAARSASGPSWHGRSITSVRATRSWCGGWTGSALAAPPVDRDREGRGRLKIEQLPDGRYRLRWYIAGRGSPRRQKTFPHGTRKKQVEAFAANLEVRRAMGELALYEQRKRPLRDLSREWCPKHAVPNLADWTGIGYKRMLVNNIEPRLGGLPVGEISPEVVADFRAELLARGKLYAATMVSLVAYQGCACPRSCSRSRCGTATRCSSSSATSTAG
jgi:hypothetical protein